MDDGAFCSRGLMMRHEWRSSPRTSGTVACRLEPSLAGGRSGEELIQQLVEGLFARPSGRRRSVVLDGVDISGPVNLPPPCLWRRCPVLHHDRIVSAPVCSLGNYVLDVDRFLGRISPVCGAGSQRRIFSVGTGLLQGGLSVLRAHFGAEAGCR